MRAVRGFERPAVQWTFAALAMVLSALVAALSFATWRLNGTVRGLRAAGIEERTRHQQVEARLARERATREALALEIARLRGGERPSAAIDVPTLTLQPLRRRESTPPAPTMTAPAPSQMIELRLVLPRGPDPAQRRYEVIVRDWVTGHVWLTRAGLTMTRIDGAPVVTAYVPGDVFASGSHEAILKSGDAEIATYEITVK